MKVCHRKLRAYIVALQLFTGDIVCQRHILPPVTEGGQLAGKTVMNVFGDFMETERLGVKIVLSVNSGRKWKIRHKLGVAFSSSRIQDRLRELEVTLRRKPLHCLSDDIKAIHEEPVTIQ